MLRDCVAAKSKWFLVALVLVVGLVVGLGPVQAQGSGRVEALAGSIEPESGILYVIPNLERGATFDFYAAGISGNLDRFPSEWSGGLSTPPGSRCAACGSVPLHTSSARDPH